MQSVGGRHVVPLGNVSLSSLVSVSSADGLIATLVHPLLINGSIVILLHPLNGSTAILGLVGGITIEFKSCLSSIERLKLTLERPRGGGGVKWIPHRFFGPKA